MEKSPFVRIEKGGVASPKGFTVGATYAGLKKAGPDKLDLTVLYSERPAAAAGVFTQSKTCSPSVTLSRQRIARHTARAVVVNSGCANACVGPQGLIDAKDTTALAAKKLGVAEEDVLIASTGMIGVELPMALIRAGMQKIALNASAGPAFARAIMTTDSHPKEQALKFQLEGKEITIGAACKGVGMIHPDMATLLCFITTDAAVEPGFLQTALKHAIDQSLNMVSVDGDTSTNDTALLLANGAAGNKQIKAGTKAAELFQQALIAVAVPLAKMVARDGEGATKLMEVTVEGAASAADARLAARTVAASPLVKAAVHGGDPNWGRIMMALGRSGAAITESKLSLYINEICVFDKGVPVPFFKEAAVISMKESNVTILAKLGLGAHGATAWGCDLTEEYVRFNSEYST
ncbi:MAG: bifunctional glutamate N-acetyltransferase/amino-acid acetyltransferase ArgJ [Chloroflexi bacterium]|nr:bifunctional glutamate N-acetyltransferase/amino-acid acetyltransferase ArgJ [Chloroflexota bacterium]